MWFLCVLKFLGVDFGMFCGCFEDASWMILGMLQIMCNATCFYILMSWSDINMSKA